MLHWHRCRDSQNVCDRRYIRQVGHNTAGETTECAGDKEILIRFGLPREGCGCDQQIEIRDN